MSDEIRLVRGSERELPPASQTPGMVREQAFAEEGRWVGFVRVEPGMVSGWHHHGDHESYLFVVAGRGRFEFGPGGSQVVEAEAGDFLHVPARLVHREMNPSDEEQTLVVVRIGDGPSLVNVDGPDEG
jgi:uncharacterized RmlC-like cupin family protein